MERIDLQGVPETMLQTLYARAAHSKRSDHRFYDAKAIEIVEQMDYDFSKAEKDIATSAGVITRTILLDKMVSRFVKENPEGTVVNIACGLDTRFYRVDNGSIRWYNLDLPETIAVRRRFLTETERVSMIPKSAMDESWAGDVAKTENKTLIVMEGVTMYLTEQDVKQILSIIDNRFDSVEIIMELMNPWIVKRMKEKSIEATNAKFAWGVKSGKDLKSIAVGFDWVKDVSLVEGMKVIYPIYRLFDWIPVVKNISNKLIVLEKGGIENEK